MKFDLFIEYNFAPIVGLLFQILILTYSKNFTKSDRRVFYVALLLEIIELATYNLEFMFSTFNSYYYARTLLSVCGYLVRPMLVYPFIILLRDYANPDRSKFKYLDLIPFGVLLIIEFMALMPNNHLVFYFSEDNTFHRGPLGFSSQIVAIFYLLECIVEIVFMSKIKNRINTCLLVVIFLYCSFSMVFESIYDIRSLGVNACIYSVILFMLALQSNHLSIVAGKLKKISEEDSLSGISNRYYGETTVRKLLNENKCGYFFILDIDNFKKINDTYGHCVGDETIKFVASALKNCISKDDVLMRLGGDEFAIYTYANKAININEFANKIFEELRNVKLSVNDDFEINVSIGAYKVESSKNATFDKIYKAADEKLYASKKIEGSYITY